MAQKNFITQLVIGGKVNPSLQKAFSSAGKMAQKTASGLGKVGTVAGKALAGIGVAAGGALAAAGAATAKVMDGFLKNSDALEKMRAQTGLSYNQLQKLQYIGGQLSVSMDSVTNAASFMNKNMSAATKTGSDAAAVFKALGVNVKNTTTGALRPQSEVFNESITALASMKNASERNAMAYKVFGKGAKDILPLLDAGTGEISRMSKEAEKLGLVLSDEAIQSGDNFGDTLERLKNVATSIGGRLAAGIIPALQKLGDTLLANAPMISAIASDVFGALGDSLVSILPSLLPLVKQLLPVAANLLKSLLPIIPPIANFISGLIPLIAPLIDMLAPFISEFIQQALPALMEVAQALLPVMLQLMQAILPIVLELLPIITDLVKIIGYGLAESIKFVMPLIQGFLSALKDVLGFVGGAVNGIAKLLGLGGKKPTPSTPNIPRYASGGFANRPSIFGDGPEPEAAIPIKRTPRSLSLLSQTARALGVKCGGNTYIYSPQVIGGNRAETEAALQSEFEKFKAWFKQMKEEEEALSFE